MIGEKLSPILEEIENALIEFEVYNGDKPDFTVDGFRAGIKIFMSVMMDKIYELQEKEDIPFKHREEMAFKCGLEIRDIVKKYTDIDTHDLYKDLLK